MQEILTENSEQDRFWIEDKLFNHGYRLGPKTRQSLSSRRRQRENPHIPHGQDMVPEFGAPLLIGAIRKGRKKRQADEYYSIANMKLGTDIGDLDIDIV